jgi:N-acetylglucosamine-6-phosphate deacetylase
MTFSSPLHSSGSVVLTGGRVLVGEKVIQADVVLERGVVSAVVDRTEQKTNSFSHLPQLNVCEHIISPGFVDLQCNGALGIDVTTEPERIWELAAHLPRWGVTSFLPTVITSPLRQVERARQTVLKRPPGHIGALPLGLHVEGPFLNPARAGAHPRKWLRTPKVNDIKNWSLEGGIVLVTLAPELEDAHEVVRVLRNGGIFVSAGHTDATYDELRTAADAGISMVTHLFNAMSPLNHRSPNVVGAALDLPHLFCGVIVDGIHVASEVVRLAFRLIGSDRFVLVTDAVAALGLSEQTLRLGDTDLVVHNDRVTTQDGTLAGSVLSMDIAVKNLVAFTGCSVADALRCATSTPAAAVGRTDLGHIRVGGPADIVVLNQDLEVSMTFVQGAVAFSRASVEAATQPG